LLLIAAGAVAAWFVINMLANYVLGIDKSVAPAVIAALVTVFSLIFVYWKDRSKSRSEAHREKKIEVYSNFFEIVFSVLRRSKENDGATQYIESEEFKDRFFDLMKGATFYGSPSVIKALSDWKVNNTSSTDPLHSIRMVGSVLLAMRKDIGLSNFGIDNLTIHQIYVNDDIRKFAQSKAIP